MAGTGQKSRFSRGAGAQGNLRLLQLFNKRCIQQCITWTHCVAVLAMQWQVC